MDDLILSRRGIKSWQMRFYLEGAMSWFKNLFGGGAGKPAATKTLEYKGFTITAEPYKEGGQYQLAGVITKDGKSYRFVRADRFSDASEAADIALAKGQLIIDEQGVRMFG
jgi:hypothetical protein